MATGIIIDKTNSPTKTSTKIRDSEKSITRNTPVCNYKNDSATRQFFVEQIGKNFHFNSYLRQFVNCDQNNLSYGDLVEVWIKEEARRKNFYPDKIGRQFEYNQFIQDFFANEKNKTLKDAIKAWKIIKTISGPNTYLYYKSI